MKITVIGSTCESQEQALMFAGHAAGICYMPHDFGTIESEPSEKTLARASNTLNSGHHSVYDHVMYNLLIEDIPKILSIVLNNEGWYSTSEKSARYTKMNVGNDIESKLYDKWQKIFAELIGEKYGEKFLTFYGAEKRATNAIKKLAQENARYMISVFTPTTMLYTVSLRQINYILGFFHEYCMKKNGSDFVCSLQYVMKEFINAIPNELKIEGLNASTKNRTISLFANNAPKAEYYGEVYFTTYLCSWAAYAQAQRHRTLHYKVKMLEDDFIPYVPPILTPELRAQWIYDMHKVKGYYPQGMLVQVEECGTKDNFILKCYERMCGCAQLEIMQNTAATMQRYIDNADEGISFSLRRFAHHARCSYPCFKCSQRCIWGGQEALSREI